MEYPVLLPDNSKLKTSHKTKLPFEQLLDAAREARILPGLQQSLLSVNKCQKKGTLLYSIQVKKE
jgi:hypothetical protein